MTKTTLLLLFAFVFTCIHAQQKPHVVKNLKITILSTMLAQEGIGEWGFAALVEADSLKILFDAGGRERTVLTNAKELKLDLSNITHLIFSHGHDDHTLGWLPLRQDASAKNKNALSVTHVAPGFFDSRLINGVWNTRRKNDSLLYTQTGGRIIEHAGFEEIFPGIYLTGGNVPRIYPEKNYPPGRQKKDADGNVVEDIIQEDMSLVIATEKGLVLLSGCGHSGLVNTVTFTQKNLPKQSLYAAIGGFHLLVDNDDQINWTAKQLKKAGLQYFMGAHCTGIEPVYQIRNKVGLKKDQCIVGSVGATFDLTNGFISGQLTMGENKKAYFRK